MVIECERKRGKNAGYIPNVEQKKEDAYGGDASFGVPSLSVKGEKKKRGKLIRS